MKLHALALCLLGTMATAVASSADHTSMRGSSESTRSSMIETYDSATTGGTPYRYTTQSGWVREVIYPDLPSEREVADKVAQIVTQNQQEIAELQAASGRARTAGWENIPTVYDMMAQDHLRAVNMGDQWLTSHNFDAPTPPAAATAADMAPEASVDHQIAMHQQMFDDSLNRAHGERSSTVRGMLLMNAATAARHISMLEMLDQDVTLGRKDLSARMQWEMNPSFMASNRAELMTRIEEEYRTMYHITDTPVAEAAVTTVEEAPAPAVQPEPPVAEAPAPAPAPVAQAPAPVVTPVTPERRVYVNPPARVAGRRQTRYRRARRPAY